MSQPELQFLDHLIRKLYRKAQPLRQLGRLEAWTPAQKRLAAALVLCIDELEMAEKDIRGDGGAADLVQRVESLLACYDRNHPKE